MGQSLLQNGLFQRGKVTHHNLKGERSERAKACQRNQIKPGNPNDFSASLGRPKSSLDLRNQAPPHQLIKNRFLFEEGRLIHPSNKPTKPSIPSRSAKEHQAISVNSAQTVQVCR
jgi:hypothetical protein